MAKTVGLLTAAFLTGFLVGVRIERHRIRPELDEHERHWKGIGEEVRAMLEYEGIGP